MRVRYNTPLLCRVLKVSFETKQKRNLTKSGLVHDEQDSVAAAFLLKNINSDIKDCASPKNTYWVGTSKFREL